MLYVQVILRHPLSLANVNNRILDQVKYQSRLVLLCPGIKNKNKTIYKLFKFLQKINRLLYLIFTIIKNSHFSYLTCNYPILNVFIICPFRTIYSRVYYSHKDYYFKKKFISEHFLAVTYYFLSVTDPISCDYIMKDYSTVKPIKSLTLYLLNIFQFVFPS